MSAELLSSKVVMEEEEPQARGIPAVPTSVAGAVGITRRGPIGQAVLCTSFEEFVTHFGGYTPDADLPLAAQGFFENGGTQLWAVRTVHFTNASDPATATALRASGTLTVGTGAAAISAVRLEGRDPGAYANRVEVEIRKASSGLASAFDLLVIEDGSYRESFPNLTLNPAGPRFIDLLTSDPRSGSLFIRTSVLPAAGVAPPPPQTVTLTGGADGLTGLDDSDFIGSDAGKMGLHALDAVQELAVLLVPGRATPAVHAALLAYAEVERSGSVFAILDPPEGQSATDMVTYVTTTAGLENASEFGAIYWPRVKILNPQKSVFGSQAELIVPPSGILAGVFARTDGARAGGVYVPPAGTEAGRLLGVLGFETSEVLEERKRDLVFPHRINPLTTGPGLPRFVDGSRTLKGDGNFPYIAERRGVSFIEQSLKQGLQFARHKNNTEELRAQVRRTITSFLLVQMKNGAFRSQVPAKAFFVDVSEALNPPSVVQAGKLVGRVGVATNKPAEFVVIRLSADTRALQEELAAAGG